MKALNTNIDSIIKTHKRIAVVGLSDNPHRASHRVAALMHREGYEVIPVNPNVAEVFGQKAYANLSEIPGEVDLVNVFRQPHYVDNIVDDAITKGAKAIWLQLGVINHPAAEKALAAGLDVVMDRCWAVEYRP